MKKISKTEFLNKIQITHIQRYRNNFVDPKLQSDYFYRDNDMLETHIKYKGASVIVIYSQITPTKECLDNSYTPTGRILNNIRIDVTTNRKFIKKHNLPFKKTNVNANKKFDKDFIFENEIQLELGITVVRKIMKEIIFQIKELFDYKVDHIVSSRCNGIYMNTNNTLNRKDKFRECILKINK
jgi:hypothetical protein